MKYYIFRHGETFPSKNSSGIYEGNNFSTKIDYEGKDAIFEMAKYLKNVSSDFNVSSPYKRCRETVEIISQITGKDLLLINGLVKMKI